MTQRPTASKSAARKFSFTEIYAALFGLFLGLAIWKFGNPVVLEQIIHPPANWQNFWNDASWPADE